MPKMSAREKWKKKIKRQLKRQAMARGEIPKKNATNNDDTANVTNNHRTENVTDNKRTANVTNNHHTENVTNNKRTENVTDNKPTENVTDNKRTENVTDNKPTENVTDNKPTENVTDNKRPANIYKIRRAAKQTEKKKVKEEMKSHTKFFKRERVRLARKFKRRTKKLLELQSMEQKDFVDYEALLELQQKIYNHEREAFSRRKVIFKLKMKQRRSAHTNVPYDIFLMREGHLLELQDANEKMNEEFQKEISKEKDRILQRTELSRARRLELEQKAWDNYQRDTALQRAELRAKTAELMVLLEEICGHPAEEAPQPEDSRGLEDIVSSEDERDIEDIVSSEDDCDVEDILSREDECDVEDILSSEDEYDMKDMNT